MPRLPVGKSRKFSTLPITAQAQFHNVFWDHYYSCGLLIAKESSVPTSGECKVLCAVSPRCPEKYPTTTDQKYQIMKPGFQIFKVELSFMII